MRNLVKSLIIITLSLSASDISAQVGIGTTTPEGALDVSSTTEGLLIPRISLTATNVATVTTPTTSELVYNTNTSAVGPNQVTPGFYYWDTTSSLWIRIATGNSSGGWSLNGNAGTIAGTNFLGTTDAQDLRFKTGGNNRLNISNTNGQVQSFFSGTAAAPAFSWNTDNNTGLYRSGADNVSLATNGTEAMRVQANGNVTIGTTYAPVNAAPANGLRVEGQTVIGKASGEDARDIMTSNTSATAYQNISGYPSNAKKRAIAGYADDSGIGVFGFSNRTGYGVVGLTQPSVISGFVQTGEGVLGQADGSSGVAVKPIGVHGIIDETAVGLDTATPVLGENNNITTGGGFKGGAYASAGNRAVAGVYGNIGSRVPSGSDGYMFGVIGDILTVGAGGIPNGSGGVMGAGGSSQFGILGYKALSGTNYCVYGGGANSSTNNGNSGKGNEANNQIGLGINGGFMGGYIKGDQYGMIAKGDKFGMYVEGNTLTNKPIVQLIENGNTSRTITYTSSSTNVDVTTRGVGQLRNGQAYIAFKNNFKSIVSKSEPIHITTTPTGETKGVYISKVTSEGFYIKENMNGNSNASFNWTAIGTRAGYENGISVSEEILSDNFDKNINGVMNNDGTKQAGTPIYFDGQNVKFEKIPEGLVKYNKKEEPKKK